MRHLIMTVSPWSILNWITLMSIGIHFSQLNLSCFKVYCTNITQNIFPISLMQLVFEARKGGIVGLCFSRYIHIYYIYVIIRLLHANHGQFGKWKNPHASSAFIPNLQSITNIISLSFSLVICAAPPGAQLGYCLQNMFIKLSFLHRPAQCAAWYLRS